jgi:uncharacterized phage protein gp47/JayE
MTYFTPDVDTISLQGAAAIQSFLGRDSTLPRSPLGVLNKTLSGSVDGLYGEIDSTAADIIYDTASEPALIRWAGIWGLTLKAPTAATGIVSFSGGTGTVPIGAILVRQDGIQYALQAAVTLEAGVGMGTVVCLSAGAMTNMADGAVLTLMTPTAGVSPDVVVGGDGLSAGADMETAPELLARLLIRIRQTPQGGSAADFEEWALSVPGVTRAWVRPGWNGPGTVGVLFMCDDRTDPIPLTADVAAVQAVINALQPVAGVGYAVAPVAVPLNPSIHLAPGSAAISAAVQADLADLISNECVPGGTLPLTQISATISEAAGVVDFVLSAPVANVTPAAGSITTMGAITWL